jgi:hypothetical protein
MYIIFLCWFYCLNRLIVSVSHWYSMLEGETMRYRFKPLWVNLRNITVGDW